MSSVRSVAALYLPGVEVPEMSEEAHRQQGKMLASRGYGLD